MAIGSKAEAEYIRKANNPGRDGWQYLGSGISRQAWLSPTGIVYKVARFASNNISEHNWAQQYRKLHREGHPVVRYVNKTLRIPRTALYCDGFVIAMEFFGTDELSYLDSRYDRGKEAARLLGCIDLHRGNIRKAGKRMALIDLGCEYFSMEQLAEAEKKLRKENKLPALV